MAISFPPAAHAAFSLIWSKAEAEMNAESESIATVPAGLDAFCYLQHMWSGWPRTIQRGGSAAKH